MLIAPPDDSVLRSVIDNLITNHLPLPPDYPVVWSGRCEQPHVRVWFCENGVKLHPEELGSYKEPTKVCVVFPNKFDSEPVIRELRKHRYEMIERIVLSPWTFLVFRPAREFQIPFYDLKSDSRVLLHYEGGFGDFFNGLRYLKFYKTSWVCEARPSLVRFAKACGLFADVVVKGQGYDCDSHCSLDDLAAIHKERAYTHPFINIPKSTDSGICFCYKGNRVKYTTRREYDPNVLRPLGRCTNLQWDEPKLDWCHNPVITDWLDTAQILSGCRAVISPSTAVLHLAGGLGKKVFAVFRPEIEQLEGAYFNSRGSKYYPTVTKTDERSVVQDVRDWLNAQGN